MLFRNLKSNIIYGKTIFLDGKLKESLLPRVCLLLHAYTIFIDEPTKVPEILTNFIFQEDKALLWISDV